MSAWRFVAVFGVVSLLADVVGVVTRVGEAAALGLRLVSGPLAARTRHFWGWAVAGYALTPRTVPLLGIAGALWVACALVIAERVGKAVRSPTKDTLSSHAVSVTGRGHGFAVHEALDQIGAIIGPLTIAGILAVTRDDYALSLGVALPGAAALALVAWLRFRVPHPESYEPFPADPDGSAVPHPWALPPRFWLYCGFVAVTMARFATFGVLSFHLATRHLLTAAEVPVVYAAALAALAAGWGYDRFGAKSLRHFRSCLDHPSPCLASPATSRW